MTSSKYEENKPFLVDAVIGNSAFLASLGSNGRMYRLWWPNIDTPQHVDAIRTGIKGDTEESISWFDDAAKGWSHKAEYLPRSNIFRVQARSEHQPIAVDSLHFAVPGLNLIVREYRFTNVGHTEQSFQFIQHSSFLIGESPIYHTTMFQANDDTLVHFRHSYFLGLSSSITCDSYQVGVDFEGLEGNRKVMHSKSIDMRPDGALAWRIDGLKPGASYTVPVYLAAGRGEEELYLTLRTAKRTPSQQWADETNHYWERYLEAAKPCPLPEEPIRELYERSLLTFKLMADEKTGSIIAAPEFDERFIRCGGYAYCWGRDAAFITTALDKAGLIELSDRFYDFTLTSQSPDGSWQQRHYHDGSLAPSWGLQIDEGASIIWGMYRHYMTTRSMPFVRSMWPAVHKGATYLLRFLDEKTGLPRPSMDLWEEREGSHTYSSAAVFGGLSAASQLARLMGEQDLATVWMEAADRIVKAMEELCWNEGRGSFYRGINLTVSPEEFNQATGEGSEGDVVKVEKGAKKYILKFDPVLDISLLGLSVPFEALPADSDAMRRTADAIEAALTIPVIGGIKRYEDDPYIGGNPWILTTLWLAQYRIAIGDLNTAKDLLQWAIDHRTSTGLLPEQVDKSTGETAWVVPLTWSHAMFVLAIFQLAEAKARSGSGSEAEATKK